MESIVLKLLKKQGESLKNIENLLLSQKDLNSNEFSSLTRTIRNTKTKHSYSFVNEITSGISTLISNPKRYKVFKTNYERNARREDDRTAKILDLSNLKNDFHIDYQHVTGYSESYNSEGEADFAIFDKKDGTKTTVGEAINWSGYNKNLRKHINKLQDKYNSIRIPVLIFLIYYDDKPEKFQKKYEYYIKKFEKDKSVIHSCKAISDITTEYTENDVIRIAKSKHQYQSKSGLTIFHFFIDFSEKIIP